MLLSAFYDRQFRCLPGKPAGEKSTDGRLRKAQQKIDVIDAGALAAEFDDDLGFFSVDPAIGPGAFGCACLAKAADRGKA